MKKVLVIILFVSGLLSAGERDSLFYTGERYYRIDSISINGNDHTEDFIILQELTFKEGDNITWEDIRYNRERIYSLGLFSFVKIQPLEREGSTTLIINVEESWYIWPIPFVNFKDNDINKITYGLSLLYKNFRGRNETLTSSFAFGYDPFYSFSYYNPWLVRDKQISFSAGFSYSTILNKSASAQIYYGKAFDYKYISGYVNVGKRLNLFNELFFVTGYNYIEIPDLIVDKPHLQTASKTRIDRSPKAGLSYFFDTRNLKQFPDSGLYFNTNYTYKGFGINSMSYSVLSLDFRHYEKIIGNLTGKWRLATRLALGKNVPFYDYSYIGHGEKIRGYFNRIIEGHYSYVGSVEVKYPIIKEWNIHLDLPIVPKELTTYRVAIYGNLFGDTGAAQFRESKLSLKDFYSGYGASLIFVFLPYNIVRVEYALNEYRKGELILEFGFSF